MEELLRAVEESDPGAAVAAADRLLGRGVPPWDVHLGLFPVAQRVVNPPFINPHLPKMHAIFREFLPFLEAEDLPALVRLEVREYARRPKLPAEAPPRELPPASFGAVEDAVRGGDARAAAAAMAGFGAGHGHRELARRLALLGSGYLDRTLGHSLSCSAFLLQELLRREGSDPWPALAALADYYVKGRFRETPALIGARGPASEEARGDQVLQAASGTGVVELHHTITLYAAERARPWCTEDEARHLWAAAVSFMGDKASTPVPLPTEGKPPADDASFRRVFAGGDPHALVAAALPLLGAEAGRKALGRFLIRAVCDAYTGEYDPHFLTGLGSLLWVLGRFSDRREVQGNALFQYAAYFFRGLERGS